MDDAEALIAAVERLDAAMRANWGSRANLSGSAAAANRPALTLAGRPVILERCTSIPLAAKERARPRRH